MVRGSFKLTNAYLQATCSAIGNKEAKGKMKAYADIIYKDNYFGTKSFEEAERKMQADVINLLKDKKHLIDLDIDYVLGGDLISQEIITNYTMKNYNIPFFGLYGACSTFAMATIIGAIIVDKGLGKSVISLASSHREAAERTFRYPVEYGGAKEDSATITVTGCGAFLIGKTPSNIKITEVTVGRVIDIGYKNSFDLGGAMAPSAIETLTNHFKAFKSSPKDYDLIVTGDLSQIGRSIVFEALNNQYNGVKNYDDCGLIAYDYFKEQVFSGGSGAGCVASVAAGYIYQKLLDKELKKVLICATGALLNNTTTLQKTSIPAISHAFVLERVDY